MLALGSLLQEPLAVAFGLPNLSHGLPAIAVFRFPFGLRIGLGELAAAAFFSERVKSKVMTERLSSSSPPEPGGILWGVTSCAAGAGTCTWLEAQVAMPRRSDNQQLD